MFRNVGILNSDAGESPKRKHTTFRTRRQFEIKNLRACYFQQMQSFYGVLLKLFDIFEIIEYCLVIMMIVARISPTWKTPARTTKAANYFRIFIVVVDVQGKNLILSRLLQR